MTSGGQVINLLQTVTDGYGRTITYTYDPAVQSGQRVTLITDILGRLYNFQYDVFGRLEAIIGPSITSGAVDPAGGTNTFPNGTAYVFRYNAAGLIHRVFYPNQVQSTAGAFSGRHVDVSLFDVSGMDAKARMKVTYDDIGMVISEEVGDAASGVGGVFTYAYLTYHPPAPNPFDPGDPISSSTGVTDRNGNDSTTYFNAKGLTVARVAYANRNKCSLEASQYDTFTSYNAQGQPLKAQYPQGNIVEYAYDTGMITGFPEVYVKMRGLLRSVVATPDATRGGSNGQSQLQTVYAYEPVYNQLCAVSEPRGNPIDGSGTLWTPQNGSASGVSASLRFATLFFYDYQKGAFSAVQGDSSIQTLLGLDSGHIGSLYNYVNGYMTALGLGGFQTGVGDINGDGVTTSRLGSRVKVQHPKVYNINKPDGTAASEDRWEIFTVNYRGQVTTHTDPEGNLTVYTRYPFFKPDGSHATTGQSSTQQYGFVKSVVVDANPGTVVGGGSPLVGPTGDLSSFAMKVSRNAVFDTQLDPTEFLALTTTITGYDQLGNPISVQNPRLISMTTDRNELGEPYRIHAPSPYSYQRQLLYDANRNVTGEVITDYRPQTDSNNQFVPVISGSQADIGAVLGPGGRAHGLNAYFNSYEYDLLDCRVTDRMDGSAPGGGLVVMLVTRYLYDGNENLVQITNPLNIVEYDYDERDLRIAQRVGRDGSTGEPGAVTVWTFDKNGNLQNAVGPVARGASGQTLSVTIADAFRGGSSVTYSGDWMSSVVYDGFDRALTATDAAGGMVESTYDPGGRIVLQEQYGTPGGATPTDRAGSNNVLLGEHESYFDEGGRLYESLAGVFLNTGGTVGAPVHVVPSGRAITHAGGGLTSNSGSNDHNDTETLTAGGESYVLTRTIFDRSGRIYQTVDDNLAFHTMKYDGANRRVLELDPLQNFVVYLYDATGNVIATERLDVGPGGDENFQTRSWYDALDRLVMTAHQGKDGSLVGSATLNGATSLSQIYQYSSIFSLTAYDSRNNASVLIDPKQNGNTSPVCNG